MNGLHCSIQFNMMEACCTKFAPDWHFSLWKMQKYEQNNTIEKLRSEVNKLSKKTIEQQDNSGNISPSSQDVESMYSVGEKVWAYYAPTDEAYPAIVTAIEDSLYIVRYIEDGVVDKVTDEGIWKFQKRKKTH